MYWLDFDRYVYNIFGKGSKLEHLINFLNGNHRFEFQSWLDNKKTVKHIEIVEFCFGSDVDVFIKWVDRIREDIINYNNRSWC